MGFRERIFYGLEDTALAVSISVSLINLLCLFGIFVFALSPIVVFLLLKT